MSTINSDLEKHLLSFFKEMADTKDKCNYDDDRDSFVFHMTDCINDLKAICNLYNNPSQITTNESKEYLRALFFHALPHLLAAAEIYDDAPEIYSMLMKRGLDSK